MEPEKNGEPRHIVHGEYNVHLMSIFMFVSYNITTEIYTERERELNLLLHTQTHLANLHWTTAKSEVKQKYINYNLQPSK